MKDKAAQRLYMQNWYAKNRDFWRAKRRDYYYKHKDNPEFKRQMRNSVLQHDFGITIEQYEALSETQNGLCAICKNVCASGKQLAVDHNHTTGKVRGLLCRRCNQGIGLFEDEPALLQGAAEYLKERDGGDSS